MRLVAACIECRPFVSPVQNGVSTSPEFVVAQVLTSRVHSLLIQLAQIVCCIMCMCCRRCLAHRGRDADAAADMLRVRSVSGDILSSFPVQDWNKDVRALKQELEKPCGLPRFRQRLLHNETALEDGAVLSALATDFNVEVQLVRIPFIDATPVQIDELVIASARGQLLEVEKILQRPQNPRLQGTTQTMPLVVAAGKGHEEIVRLLLEARSDEALTEPEFGPAVLKVCQNHLCMDKHLEIVNLLLGFGGQRIIQRDDEVEVGKKCSPGLLRRASSMGHTDIVKILLANGADKNMFNGCGCSNCLHEAAREGYADILLLLVQAMATNMDHDKIDLTDYFGKTPLHEAAEAAQVEMARILLKARAGINLQTFELKTALWQCNPRCTPFFVGAHGSCTGCFES